jgi:pheromone a factor receptor
MADVSTVIERRSTHATSAAAIVLPILAFVSLVLCIPPLVSHIRARNLPAIVLVTGVIIYNLESFLNALIWPSYPLNTKWDGQGLCDVEVRLYFPINFAIAGSVACIFRQLAIILDMNRPFIRPSKHDDLKDRALEISLCLVGPLYATVAHFVVQPSRYALTAVFGCYATTAYYSWVTSVLLLMWPPVIGLVAVGYCTLLIIRLLRYRRSVSGILSNASTITRARYLRLFGLASGLLVIYLPLCIYVLSIYIRVGRDAYSWSVVHPPDWSSKIEILDEATAASQINHGVDRWAYVGVGFILFLLFGVGQEASIMYKSCLAMLGFGRWWPGWHGRIPSMSSKRRRSQQQSTNSTTPSHSEARPITRDAIDIELARIDAEDIEIRSTGQ